jgi:hypothetical protein
MDPAIYDLLVREGVVVETLQLILLFQSGPAVNTDSKRNLLVGGSE